MAQEAIRQTRATGSSGLGMFFAIAYAFTWLLQAPVALSEDGAGWLGFTPSDAGLDVVLVGLSSFGPSVAALITLRAMERAGEVGGSPGAVRDLLRRCVRARVPVVWYLLAIPGVMLLLIGAAFLVPGAAAHATFSVETVLVLVVLLVTVQLVFGALGEEPGWRRFALPRLQQRLGPLGASVVLGVLWGCWHAPLFLVPDWIDHKGGTNLWTAGQYLLFTVGASIVMTWIFNNARQSVLLMIAFHAAVNTSLSGIGEMFPDSDLTNHQILLPTVIGFCAAGLVVVAVSRARLSYRPMPAAESPDVRTQ